MRPVRLHLQGFLSHQDTVLDFTDVKAAVLVGENGAGKTAICDGITWALFGKRPRPGQPINDRATVCRVAFIFRMGDAHPEWRVTRERTVGGKGSLAFAVCLDGERWEPAGGTHIAEIQRAIEDVLGVSYETLLGSSFLGQGLADEFTRRRPGERKELLYQLLDLDRYERWCQAARDSERQLAGQAAQAQHRLEELEDFLSGEGKAREDVAAATREKEAAAAALADAEARLTAVHAGLEEARGQVAAVRESGQELSHLRRERKAQKDRLLADVERIRREAKSLEGQHNETTVELHRLDQSARGATTLEADATAKKLAAESLEHEAVLIRDKASIVDSQAQLAEREAEVASRAAREAVQRIDVLAKGDAATCFACRQALTAEHRDGMIAELTATKDTERQRFTDHGRIATDKALEAADLRRTADRNDREANVIRQEITALKTKAERGRVAAERIPEVTRNRDRILENTAELETEMEKARSELGALDEPSERERQLEAELAGAAAADDRLNRAQLELVDRESEVGMARGRLTSAVATEARAETELRPFDSERERMGRVRREFERLAEQRYVDSFLGEVWSKNGIPALIIENAVPQIEDEANRELERFTDGRFVVRLESQTATQAGDIRETLKIVVTADGAERPLEELSGGERQVVDLALRLGLARLLAHRGGRPIETLVLDEAFTALDVGRRQRAVEVLRGLLEEFRVVIAVTHDRDFADAFPVRIEVSNDGEGSRVDVVRAGAQEAA